MRTRAEFRTLRQLPRVVAVTLIVAVVPSVVVWGVLVKAIGSSPLVSILLTGALSVILSQLCSLWWERSRGAGEVLFGDLMIWEWARRWLSERRLARSGGLLGRDLRYRDRVRIDGRPIRSLLRLASDLQASDPYTHGHSRRVARYSYLIAGRMHLSPSEVARIRVAAALHDVGKIDTPTQILHKRERLTDAEFDVVKRHAAAGAEMISAQGGDDDVAAIVRSHHERLDGGGYPDGLAGEEIPVGARIIAVADTFDAIVSRRPYRPGKPHKVALDILRSEAGTQLDPQAVAAFRRVYYRRRPLGAFVTFTNLAADLLSGLTPGGAQAARVLGTAALAAGVGGAVVLPSFHAHLNKPHRLVARHAAAGERTLLAGHGAARAGAPAGERCCFPGRGGTAPGGRSRGSRPGQTAPAGPTTGSSNPGSAGASTPAAPAAASSSARSGGSGSSAPAGSSSSGTVGVRVPVGGGGSGVSATVSPPGGGSGSGVGATVTTPGGGRVSGSAGIGGPGSGAPGATVGAHLP